MTINTLKDITYTMLTSKCYTYAQVNVSYGNNYIKLGKLVY